MKNRIRLRLLLYFLCSFLVFSVVIGLSFYLLFSEYNTQTHKEELEAKRRIHDGYREVELPPLLMQSPLMLIITPTLPLRIPTPIPIPQTRAGRRAEVRGRELATARELQREPIAGTVEAQVVGVRMRVVAKDQVRAVLKHMALT